MVRLLIWIRKQEVQIMCKLAVVQHVGRIIRVSWEANVWTTTMSTNATVVWLHFMATSVTKVCCSVVFQRYSTYWLTMPSMYLLLCVTWGQYLIESRAPPPNKHCRRLSAAHEAPPLNKIRIHCSRCNAVPSQQWEFIFINSDVFQFKVSISRRSLIQFSLQNLRVPQFLREGCKLCRYGKTNLPLSLPCNFCSNEIVSICL